MIHDYLYWVTQRSAPITLLIGWNWESIVQQQVHITQNSHEYNMTISLKMYSHLGVIYRGRRQVEVHVKCNLGLYCLYSL